MVTCIHQKLSDANFAYGKKWDDDENVCGPWSATISFDVRFSVNVIRAAAAAGRDRQLSRPAAGLGP
jgi:hypothetical protein